MKAIRRERLVLGLVFFLAGSAASAGVTPGSGISGSAHDFTKAASNPSGGGAKLCDFCHFQDRGINGLNLPLSLWGGSSQTHGGTRLPANLATWAGSSKLCLSCHAAAAARHAGRVPLWSQGGYPRSQPDGGAVGDVAGTGSFHAVAPRMDESHPVGIPYPYLRVPGTYNNITTGPAVDLSDYVPVPMNVKLFTTTDDIVVAGTRLGDTGMECATCHDVHNEQVRDHRLLRDTKRQLCFNCHDL